MPLMDEFKEEREEMKSRCFQDRWNYFWDYYKWHVVAGIIIVCVAITIIHGLLTRKETAFYVAMMNSGAYVNADEYVAGFEEAAGIDRKKSYAHFDAELQIDYSNMNQASISTAQKMLVYIASGDVDVMLADTDCMNRYAYNMAMMDLREFLTAEETAIYEPYFYYIDYALAEEAANSLSDPEFPTDPSDPSGMKEPIPVGILLPDCPDLDNYYLTPKPLYFGVCPKAKHPDLAHVFLEYITRNSSLRKQTP